MFKFVVRRLLLATFSLFGISVITFVVIRLIPGTAIDYLIGTSIGLSQEQVTQLQHYYGLDVPIWQQYFVWIGYVMHGNLGISIQTHSAVLPLILSRIPITAELSFLALLVAACIGLPIGTLSALRPNTWIDLVGRVFSLVGLSMPNFWLGTMMILLFSTVIVWLPNGLSYVGFNTDPGMNLQQNVLPAVALGLGISGSLMRMTRSAVLDVLSEDYIRTARAKGLSFRRVLAAHVLRNGLIPIITIVGVLAGYLLSGAVIVEQIFNVPGVGRLLLTSIQGRDYAVVQGSVLVIAIAFVFSNLVADIGYGLADPRIRQS
jgi:peptide/nickel transport system permease protein